MAEICIFPIPGCVTFPGTVFPLHVFEPRYRSMIQRCLDQDGLVAICHTQSVISPAKPADNMNDALSSNQATYRPYDVFSAGRCELIETTTDGRMYLNVHIEQRFRLGEEVQLLPYQVYECEPFPDRRPTPAQQADNELLKQKILHRLLAIVQADESLDHKIAALLSSSEWQAMDAENFSFRLFGIIRFEAEILQQCLQLDNANDRLSFALSLLNEED